MLPLDKLIAKINEYSTIAKQRKLTPTEMKERQELRQQYLKYWRNSVQYQLENVVVIDKHNNRLTMPRKKPGSQKRKSN